MEYAELPIEIKKAHIVYTFANGRTEILKIHEGNEIQISLNLVTSGPTFPTTETVEISVIATHRIGANALYSVHAGCIAEEP